MYTWAQAKLTSCIITKLQDDFCPLKEHAPCRWHPGYFDNMVLGFTQIIPTLSEPFTTMSEA